MFNKTNGQRRRKEVVKKTLVVSVVIGAIIFVCGAAKRNPDILPKIQGVPYSPPSNASQPANAPPETPPEPLGPHPLEIGDDWSRPIYNRNGYTEHATAVTADEDVTHLIRLDFNNSLIFTNWATSWKRKSNLILPPSTVLQYMVMPGQEKRSETLIINFTPN